MIFFLNTRIFLWSLYFTFSLFALWSSNSSTLAYDTDWHIFRLILGCGPPFLQKYQPHYKKLFFFHKSFYDFFQRICAQFPTRGWIFFATFFSIVPFWALPRRAWWFYTLKKISVLERFFDAPGPLVAPEERLHHKQYRTLAH